jgi:hypothetical protein
MYTRVRHFGINTRAFVTVNPVSSVTCTVPEPDAGNGVAPMTDDSDSVSGFDVHDGEAMTTVDGGVGAVGDVVATFVVVGTKVVDVAIVVVGVVDVVWGSVVATVVEGVVVVGVTVHDRVMEPSPWLQPV